MLAQRPTGTVMLLGHIARTRGLPASFLARIFQKLRRHHLVTSHRGAVRGYALARPARAITLLDVFEATEGPHFLDGCIFRTRRCQERGPCRLHEGWVPLAAAIRRTLARTTLQECADAARPSGGRRVGRGSPRVSGALGQRRA